jgi:hypothetical protein
LDSTLDLQEQLTKARKRIVTQLNSFVEDAIQSNEDLLIDDDDDVNTEIVSPSLSMSPSPSPSFSVVESASPKQQALETTSIETTPFAILKSSTLSVIENATASLGLNSSMPNSRFARGGRRGIREAVEVSSQSPSTVPPPRFAMSDLLQFGESDDTTSTEFVRSHFAFKLTMHISSSNTNARALA